MDRDLQRLLVYASARADEDTRESGPRALRQEGEALAVDFAAASAFFRPEILKLDRARLRSFQSKEKRLAPYAHYLEDVLRWKPHTLGRGRGAAGGRGRSARRRRQLRLRPAQGRRPPLAGGEAHQR